MPSFDIVSEIEISEVRNAIENANRDLTNRYDFRGVDASFELKDEIVSVIAPSDHQVQQMMPILRTAAMKRGIDAGALEVADKDHTGRVITQKVKFKQGIEKDVAKKIVKSIKDSKIKVQAAIQGESLRVTGKKRDDLQSAMALVREGDFGQPFQFNNFKD